MDISEIHKNWTDLGKDDPMWVVLTDPAKKGNKWNEEEFFAHGRTEIAAVMAKLKSMNAVPQPGKAMDFGCGVGRLSQALAQYFNAVDGVDVSGSMIEKANSWNKHPGKVKYHLNVREDLQTFASDSYDFIYSSICIQHIPTDFQRKYIGEFARVLKPGGIAYFQTIKANGWRGLIPNSVADTIRKIKSKGEAFIPLYGVPIADVEAAIQRNGGRILKIETLPYEGWESRYTNVFYLVTKER